MIRECINLLGDNNSNLLDEYRYHQLSLVEQHILNATRFIKECKGYNGIIYDRLVALYWYL